jgi:hydrogenase maturation factor
MHDPTEGGLATALRELAVITGGGILVNGDVIPIYPETRAICAALKLDPLGLIASGALLAVVAATEEAPALAALEAAGVHGALIGTLTSRTGEFLITTKKITVPLATFETDELARYFAQVT